MREIVACVCVFFFPPLRSGRCTCNCTNKRTGECCRYLCKSAVPDTEFCMSEALFFFSSPPLMNTRCCLPTSLLTHIQRRLSRAHRKLAPLSWERCSNYCSLADGALIAAIFHQAFHCPPRPAPMTLRPAPLIHHSGRWWACACISCNRGGDRWGCRAHSLHAYTYAHP